MTREETVAVFTRREAAMNRHDMAAASDMYAESAVVESPAAGGTVRGRAAIEDLSRAWFAGFPDVAVTTEDLLIDGDSVVWVVAMHGTDTGGFMDMPATGKPFRLPMVFTSTFKDGRMVHERRVYDFTGLLVQIGVLKAKPA